MSLRAKLLLMFAALAVAPLLGVGTFDYVWSRRTLEAHVVAQDSLLAVGAADELERRLDVQTSDLAFLAENAETRRLYRSLADPAEEARASVRAEVEPWLAAAWRQFAPSYHGIELRDGSDGLVLRLGSVPMPGDEPASIVTVRRPIEDSETRRVVGVVVAWPRLETLLPGEALATRFGSAGYSLVVDRGGRRVLYHPRVSRARRPWRDLADDGLVLDSARLAAPHGHFSFRAADTLRVAAFASLASPPWTVITTSAVDEFAGPFTRGRLASLGLVFVVILSVSLASVWLVRRSTRSLAALTAAADRVGHGDLAPALPPPGPDEVGRLAAGFDTMLRRVREMIAEVERSRQLAAVGEFAAELSHEIRNPLTSVKLNLQRVERLRAQGELPASAEGPLRISLREVDRLERVVRGVLALGRLPAHDRTAVSVHRLLRDTLDALRPDAERRAVTISDECEAPFDGVLGDDAALRSAVLNLCANALDAMPEGGLLRVTTAIEASDGSPRIVVRVQDTGTGIPEECRPRLFHPFFTTKPEGTGLGLALAARTAEEHGGRLALEATSSAGTTFRLDLPLETP